MTKKELMEALDGLDDETLICVEIKLCVLGHLHVTQFDDLIVQNVYGNCVILHVE